MIFKKFAGNFSLLLAVAFIFLLQLACGLFSRDITSDPILIYTSAAETAQAKLTLSAGQAAVAELTRQAAQPSPSPIPQTSTPAPTAIFISPTPTFPAPSPTIDTVPCDLAEFVGDVTIPPGTSLPAGANFIKIWRTRNIGSCAWNSQYALVFGAGDAMTGNTASSLPGSVQPGQIIDLQLNQTAPTSPSSYTGNWYLRNSSGINFGHGSGGSEPFRSQVITYFYPGIPNSSYDFGQNFCSARWSSATGPLSCPGVSNDPNGLAILLQNQALETGVDSRPVLWTRPNSNANGTITGLYPAYTVRDGDHFVTELGCLSNSPGCDVTFSLAYTSFDNPSGSLGSWREVYDGITTPVDINISWLAGQPVQIVLSVRNNAVPSSANAYWLAPHIEKLGSSSQPNLVLDWNQTGRSGGSCDRLRIFRMSNSNFGAEALTCTPDGRSLGSRDLNSQENILVSDWVNRLRTFDTEISRTTSTGQLTTRYNFYGRGGQVASNTDIEAINSLAEQIFLSIAQ